MRYSVNKQRSNTERLDFRGKYSERKSKRKQRSVEKDSPNYSDSSPLAIRGKIDEKTQEEEIQLIEHESVMFNLIESQKKKIQELRIQKTK